MSVVVGYLSFTCLRSRFAFCHAVSAFWKDDWKFLQILRDSAAEGQGKIDRWSGEQASSAATPKAAGLKDFAWRAIGEIEG